MKDSGEQLQTEYYRLLSGNITYDGVTIPVYDIIPRKAEYPYIKILDRTAVDLSTKTSLGQEVTQTLQIVARFNHGIGSRKGIYNIGADIISIIRDRPIRLNLTDFNVINSILDNANTKENTDEKYNYLIYNLRFRHKLEEV